MGFWKRLFSGKDSNPSLEKPADIATPKQIANPGFYKGRHFTEYVPTVKELLRADRTAEAEELLWALVGATEAECNAEGFGVAPWYYEELADLFQKRPDLRAELGVLERFARQQHAPGVTPPRLLKRLAKVRVMAKSADG